MAFTGPLSGPNTVLRKALLLGVGDADQQERRP